MDYFQQYMQLKDVEFQMETLGLQEVQGQILLLILSMEQAGMEEEAQFLQHAMQ